MSQGSLCHTCLKQVRIQFVKNTHTNCTIGALSVTFEQQTSHECLSFYDPYIPPPPSIISILLIVKTYKRTQDRIGVVNASDLITWMFLFLKKIKIYFRKKKKTFLINPFLLVPIISLVPTSRWNPPVPIRATCGIIPSALHEYNQWIHILFYWYQLYHWWQWTIGATSIQPI